jgi:uncharacterized membrane protein
MNPQLEELLHIIARWVHLIAGIMWIGNSLLFNWLDRNLEPPKPDEKNMVGRMWMVHSGGFYEVEKKYLAPSEMPANLHWFKWQNGITWLSGITLLILVFYMGGAALMVDPQKSSLSPTVTVAISVACLVGAYLAYGGVWRSPLGKNQKVGIACTVLIIVGFSAAFFQFLSGRAAFIHIGVMLGTMMTGNVWFVIMPSQRELIAATMEGREQNPAIGYQAKARSVHNNYFTFPLLFIMLSNHFPSTFGGRYGWAILTVFALGSALIRHLMNLRYQGKKWLAPALGVFAITAAGGWFLMSQPAASATIELPPLPKHTGAVSAAQAYEIVQKRCIQCHSSHPTDKVWKVAPAGMILETPAQIRANRVKIKLRVGTMRNMPFNNTTEMTMEERSILIHWIDTGTPD